MSGTRDAGPKLLLAALGLLFLSLPSYDRNYAWLAGIAITPWTLLLARREWKLGVLWVAGAYYMSLPVVYRYLFSWGDPVPFLYPLLVVPFFLPFPLLVRVIATRTNLPLALVAPLGWVAAEFAQTELVYGHGAIYMLGYQLAPYRYLVQTADLGGFYAASFLAAATGGAWADLWLWLRDRRPSVRRRTLRSLALMTTLYAVASSYSIWRLRNLELQDGPRVALVQPNLPRTEASVLETMLRQSILTLKHVRPGAAQLVVWPENSILDRLTVPDKYLVDLAFLGTTLQAEFLVGAYGAAPHDLSRHTNSAFLVAPGGDILARYDKNLLVAWGEYLPWQAALGWLHPDLPLRHQLAATRLLGYTPNGFAGSETVVFEAAGMQVSPLICFENTLPRFAREAALGGAEVLVNMTSERRVGRAMQDQLLGISMFRAIETRRPLLRDGNAGVSAFIAPDGRVYSILHGADRGDVVDDAGVLVDRVILNRDRSLTFYVRHGDLFAWIVTAGAVLTALWALVAGGARRRWPLGAGGEDGHAQ